jgi:hypothetical protein
MPRRAKGLTAAFVDKTTKIGRHADGGGLYLLVRSHDAKFWEAHFTLRGKRRSMGGGPATERNAIRLADAREWARQVQAAVREGRDPIAERQAARAASDAEETVARAKAITFRAVTDMYIAAHEASWRSAVDRDQWRSSLDRYAMPVIVDMPVAQVETSNVMLILEPLWRSKTETASRVRGRIERVLDFAAARGWRTGENPARWRGYLDKLLPARRRAQRVEHHRALDWHKVGAFMKRLRELNSIAARALEFAILTAASIRRSPGCAME